MNNLNSFLIEGNLTADPEFKPLQSGKNLCKFAIASNRYYRNSEKELIQEVAYFNVETWESLALTCSAYLTKGKRVRVVGRIRHDRWQAEDEKMRERYVVVAEHVDFPFSKKEESPDDSVETEEEVE